LDLRRASDPLSREDPARAFRDWKVAEETRWTTRETRDPARSPVPGCEHGTDGRRAPGSRDARRARTRRCKRARRFVTRRETRRTRKRAKKKDAVRASPVKNDDNRFWFANGRRNQIQMKLAQVLVLSTVVVAFGPSKRPETLARTGHTRTHHGVHRRRVVFRGRREVRTQWRDEQHHTQVRPSPLRRESTPRASSSPLASPRF
jgi:hypothetical protein